MRKAGQFRIYEWKDGAPSPLPAKLARINFSSSTQWVQRDHETILFDRERGEMFYSSERTGLCLRFPAQEITDLTPSAYREARGSATQRGDLTHL